MIILINQVHLERQPKLVKMNGIENSKSSLQ